MTAYTSIASGNWNDSSKWSPTGFPNSSGDTAVIGANLNMTVPASATIACGLIDYQDSTVGTTTVTINGTLNMSGDITPGAVSRIAIGAGGILDLNGHSVAPTGSVTYSFQGIPGVGFTVRSTGSLGTFADTFPSSATSSMAYGTISGLNAPTFGRLVSTGHVYSYVTFTGIQGALYLERGSNSAGATLSISHCDFRNPVNADPQSASAYQPFVSMSSTSSASRLMEYCTFATNGSKPGVFQIDAGNMRYTENRANGWLYGALRTDGVLEAVFFATPFDASGSQNDVFMIGTGGQNNFANMHKCYGYYTGGDHAFGFLPNSFDKTATENVMEHGGTLDAGDGANWFLFGPGTNYAFTGSRNIFLGHGAPYQFAAASQTITPTTFTISNNTSLVNNGGLDPFLPSLCNTEQHCVLDPSGSVDVYNNLVFNPTSEPTDAAVYIEENNADQVTLVDYNVGWTAAGATIPPVKYVNVTPTDGGPGTHDFATDPNFVDRTRTLATWDASLGGPGTADHAITQILAINANGADQAYSVTALVDWVRAGYVPRNSRLIGSGLNGLDIGAMPPQRTPVIFYKQGGLPRFATAA